MRADVVDVRPIGQAAGTAGRIKASIPAPLSVQSAPTRRCRNGWLAVIMTQRLGSLKIQGLPGGAAFDGPRGHAALWAATPCWSMGHRVMLGQPYNNDCSIYLRLMFKVCRTYSCIVGRRARKVFLAGIGAGCQHHRTGRNRTCPPPATRLSHRLPQGAAGWLFARMNAIDRLNAVRRLNAIDRRPHRIWHRPPDRDQSAERTASALLTSNPPGASTPRWVTLPSSATRA
jgi:hypothetical protein